MKTQVYNLAGEVVDEIDLRDDVFGIVPNTAVMHQALVRQQANARLGTADTKTRGEVRGGGKKPWRQKGTGRARQGSTRAPHWRGGGVVFGPHPRSYRQAMPRKMRRLAMRSVLSVKARDGQLRVIDDLASLEPRTKAMVQLLGDLGLQGSTALMLLPEPAENVRRAAGNHPGVTSLLARYINVRDGLKYDYLILPRRSVNVLEGILGGADEGGADEVAAE